MEDTKIETEINGMPKLREIPENIIDVFVSALLDEILKMCEVE